MGLRTAKCLGGLLALAIVVGLAAPGSAVSAASAVFTATPNSGAPGQSITPRLKNKMKKYDLIFGLRWTLQRLDGTTWTQDPSLPSATESKKRLRFMNPGGSVALPDFTIPIGLAAGTYRFVTPVGVKRTKRPFYAPFTVVSP
jgi:hypothetical protein